MLKTLPPDKMRAYRFHGERDLRAEDLERPKALPGQVVLRVRRAGICGSDIHYYSHGRIGAFVPKRPFILGHEFAGEVVSIGEGAAPSLLGQRVTVDPSIPCGECKFCRGGRYNLCRNMRFYGSASCDPHIDGGFAEYTSVPSANCFSVPDSLGWGEAAMIEPLSVAVHAARRAGDIAGRKVLVTGGGAIGQLTALVSRAFGASWVVMSDIAAYPRNRAVELGADAALEAKAQDFEAQALSLTQGGFDFVFEASGSPHALAQAITVAERGATIVQVGTLPTPVTAPLNSIMAKELNYIGSFRFANVFATALDLAISRRIDLSALISAVLPLGDMNKAMELAIGKNEIVKVQVEP
jgi:threonine dehydrogenase-like Zn-dependent dehydrogenase